MKPIKLRDKPKESRFLAEELAKWALLGDPYARIPTPLKPLIRRIMSAIRYYDRGEKL